MKTIRFVVDGEVQGKTYRPHLVAKARKHGVGGYVKNLLDGTVEIVCSGDDVILNKFYDDIKGEIGTKLKDCLADVAHVSDPEELSFEEHKYFIIKYGETNEEIAEGLATGAAYIRELGGDVGKVGNQIKNGFEATNNNFKTLDDKYHTISESLNSVSNKLDLLPDKLAEKLSKIFSIDLFAKALEEHDKRLIKALKAK